MQIQHTRYQYGGQADCNQTFFVGDYKNWTQDPRTGGPKDPRTEDPSTQSLVLHCSRYSVTLRSICYKPKLTAMSCTLSLCTPKDLFIAKHYSPTSLILKVVYYQSCKARLPYAKQESLHLC